MKPRNFTSTTPIREPIKNMSNNTLKNMTTTHLERSHYDLKLVSTYVNSKKLTLDAYNF